MLLPVEKLYDVRLNTGRYVLYRYMDAHMFPRWLTKTECLAGFVLDEEGKPIWISGIFGGHFGHHEPAPTYTDFVVYSERTGGVFALAVPRFDHSSRVSRWNSMYSYMDERGQVHALLHRECSRFDRAFTPCGRKQFIGYLNSRVTFYDGELLYCFYWWWGEGNEEMHVIKLSPDLEVERYFEIPLPDEAQSAWVCKRASTHDYVGLVWAGDVNRPTRVYAIRRVESEPYVALEMMYDINAMGGVWFGVVSAYVDDSCFAGLLLVGREEDPHRPEKLTWYVYTFKWTPGQSFPPPLTLRATFMGATLFAAMISPDDYVVAYLCYNEANDRDEIHIIGADSYVFYGDPYLVTIPPSGREPVDNFVVSPSGILASTHTGLWKEHDGTWYRYWHALLYVPDDEYWRHMNRDREVRVRWGSACCRLLDGSYACLEHGVKVPLGCYTDSSGTHVVLYNFETGRLEDYLHLDNSRVRVGDCASPFSLPSHWWLTWEFPLVVDNEHSYFFAADGDMVRLVKLHAPSKQVVASDLRLSASTLFLLRLKKVGLELHVAACDYSRITRAIVDAGTMRTLYIVSIPYDYSTHGWPLAVVPVWIDEKGMRYVALVVAVDQPSGKIVVHLAADDGTIVSASADDPDTIPVFPRQKGVSVDAWWDGSRVFAVVAATPLAYGHDAKLLWVKYDAAGFRYGVLRELKPSGYTIYDRRPLYAFISKVRVSGWEKWELLLEPDDEYIYPPKQWLAEGLYPLFTCEATLPPGANWPPLPEQMEEEEFFLDVVPLQASQDGSVIFSYPGLRSPGGELFAAFAVMPPHPEIGSFFYIVKAPAAQPPPPPPPPLPPARRLLTLFRGRVGGV